MIKAGPDLYGQIWNKTSALQLYGTFLGDGQSANLADWISESTDSLAFLSADELNNLADHLRRDAAAEAVQASHAIPGKRFGFSAYGQVHYDEHYDVMAVHDPVGTAAHFALAQYALDAVVNHLTLIWQEWEPT